ncbi:MAG TPA: hypothetical protein DCR14_01560 [Acidimicrobiaceae bacterium]|nr:hypothetical protein [Acidimicrobiaceae bacterium]
MMAMGAWTAAGLYLALAVGIASAATFFGSRGNGRRAVPQAFGRLFELVEERRTFMGLGPIVATARTHPWVLIIVVFASAPTVAAVVVAAAGAPLSVGDLVGSLALWRSVDGTQAFITYAVIGVVHAAVCWWYLRLNRAAIASGAAPTTAVLRGRSRADVAGRLAVGAVLDEGGTLEELGWRAFLLPLLLVELDRGPATLTLAVLWWAWHLPREVATIRRKGLTRTWIGQQSIFLGVCIGLSVLCTEVVLRTGSVWPAILVHGGTNVWSKALGGVPNSRWNTDVRTIIVALIALPIAVMWVIG